MPRNFSLISLLALFASVLVTLQARAAEAESVDLVSVTEPVRLVDAKLAQVTCSSCIRLWGTIELKDIAYDKEVDVFYGCSLNESDPNSEWRWRAKPAEFQGRDDGGEKELWKFQIDLPGCFSKARLAVRYKVAGNTYWDNNCGWNYQINRQEGNSAGIVIGRQHSCIGQ